VARNRGRRRRQNLKLLIALAVTLALVVLVRDVARLARQSNSQRASLNQSFAVLATSVLNDEATLRGEVTAILSGASTMTRPILAARLALVRESADSLRQRVALLAKPSIAHGVQNTLITVTDLRSTAVSDLASVVSSALDLPGGSSSSATVSSIESSVLSSDNMWASAHTELVGEPGHVSLPASTFALTTGPLATAVNTLLSVPALAPTRAMTIAAVSVTPAPLPAPIGVLKLIPVTSIDVAVAVRNTQYISQGFAVTLTVRPTTAVGVGFSRSLSSVAGPLGGRALSFPSIAVVPGERATVTISLTGVAPATSGGGLRQYVLSIAPAPLH